MSKTTIWVVVGIVILAGIGGYFAMQKPATDDASNLAGGTVLEGTEGEWNDTPESPMPEGKKMAFSQLVAQGGSYECTVNQYVGETESKGTAYISSGLVRGEFKTQAKGLNINTSLIVRDGYTYSWTSMAPNMGFKAKVVASAEVNPNQSASGSYSWNADQIGDYDCKDWTADMSKFELPAGINFQEIN